MCLNGHGFRRPIWCPFSIESCAKMPLSKGSKQCIETYFVDWAPYVEVTARTPCQFSFKGEGGSTEVQVSSTVSSLRSQQVRG